MRARPSADAQPTVGTDEEALARLAKLKPLDYARTRTAEAKRLGVTATELDKLIKGLVKGEKPLQGRRLNIPRPEPWPEPVDGVELLCDLSDFYTRHVVLPSGGADTLAVWALHTHCLPCLLQFDICPKVIFVSPEKQCGKTTAIDTLGLTVSAPLSTTNVTAAAVFRTIELAHPTLLIDEADSFMKNSDDMRNVVNAGHKRGAQVIRCVGDDSEVRAFDVFGPMALCSIGKLGRYGTIEDRSLIIKMQRATRVERPAPLDQEAKETGVELARKCARFAADRSAALAKARPNLPPKLFNRVADNWRPLFAIAQVAGGDWPEQLVY
jgi:putative DNA primase/helicase